MFYRCGLFFFFQLIDFFFLLLFFFSAPNLCGHWTDINKSWIGTYSRDCYVKNYARSPPDIYLQSNWLGGQKPLIWGRLRNLTKNISAMEHDINNRKQTRQSTATPLHATQIWWILVQKRLRRVGKFCAHPQKFACRTSYRLTFATHFGLIIFSRWRLRST